MAHVPLNGDSFTSQGEKLGLFARLKDSLAKYSDYRRTVNELERLSNSDLRDLGLSRFSIRQVAYDAVYGE